MISIGILSNSPREPESQKKSRLAEPTLELELELELTVLDGLMTEPHTFFSREAILIKANLKFCFVNRIGLDH